MTTLSDNSGDAVRYDAPSQSSRRDAPHARLNSRAGLRGELALGRQELSARFRSSPPRILGSRELLVAAVGSRDVIYHLRAGWACQFRDLSCGRTAIVDIYLPGDV